MRGEATGRAMDERERRRSGRGAAALALAALLGLATGCGPWDRTPGFRLFGVVTAGPVDWSFTDHHPTIALETRTWYRIPHSVTTGCFRFAGDLYVPSRNAAEKRWVAHVQRDPRVRLRIAGRIYERRARRVTDPDVIGALYRGLGRKYPRFARAGEAPPRDLWFFKLEEPV